jgi:hypothetical protein
VRYGVIDANVVETYDSVRGIRSSTAAPDRLAGVASTGGDTYYVRCNPDDSEPACDVAVSATAAGTDPDRELARADRPTPASWFRGWVAFSAYDASLPGYRLTLRSRDGDVRRPAVPPRAVPFDVDLGPGPGGRLTAVYSRCRVEPRIEPGGGFTVPATGRGCDVYRYDTRTGREAKVTGAGLPGVSEFLPAIDRSRIAFARRRGHGAAALYVAPLAGGRLTRMSGGPRGADDDLGPRALDLRGDRLAVVWDHRLGDGRLRSEVRLDVLGRRPRTLATTTSRNGARRHRSPGFDGHVLSWVSHGLPGLPRTVAVRYDVPARSRRIFALPDAATVHVPWAVQGDLAVNPGVYGRIDGSGWSLRTAGLPEILP